MATLTPIQARSYAAAAGFTGQAQDVIVAIAQAESSLNTQAKHVNSDGSIDRGILQINGRWHPEISDVCAYDPACAFKAGWAISSQGKNFTPWSTYTGGQYLHYLSSNSSSSSSTGGTPWWKYPVTHGYITTFQGAGTDTPHFAEDLAVPFHTPLSFLEPGTIVKADYQLWGGEVFEQPDAGGPQEYHFHLDDINVKIGQHVQAGESIGLSGGQTSGGDHPTDPSQSTGPHDHFGLFEKYTDTEIGTRPYGPDPSALLAKGANGSSGTNSPGLSGSGPSPLSQKVNDVLSEAPGFAGIARALDIAEQFPGIKNHLPEAVSVNAVAPGWAGDIVNGIVSGITSLGAATLDPQDYIGGAFLTVIDTVWSNLLPFLFRSFLVIVGLVLIIALLWKAVDATGLPEMAASATPAGAAMKGLKG